MLCKKLRIKEGMELVVLQGPDEYKKITGPLPPGVVLKTRLGKAHDFIHLFVKNRSELERKIKPVLKVLKPGAFLWISYPKTSSGIQTDLSRDKGWTCLENCQMRWMSMISFDTCWSAFLMKNENTPPESKVSQANKEMAAAYFNARTKTVRIPDDLKTKLAKHTKARSFFDSLSYTCRKEYVVWIVTAKQEATRQNRLLKTIEKLLAGKKNPAQK